MKIKKIFLILLIIPFILSGCTKQKDQTNNQLFSDTTETYSKRYSEILDKYRYFIENYINKETILQYDIPKSYRCEPWSTIYSQMADTVPGSYGYAFKNLNGSDIPILLLLTKNIYYDDYFINAIYSLVDNNPKLLETYWYRSRCYLGADNFIYEIGSSGAAYNSYLKRKIKPDSTDIETLQGVRTDFDDKESKVCYYRINSNHEETEISEQEFEKIISQMPQDNKQSDLEFISLQ